MMNAGEIIGDLEVHYQERGRSIYIFLKGHLDYFTFGKLILIYEEDIKNKDFSEIILDLKDLNYIDSSGIGAIYRLHNSLKKRGKKLYLTNPSKTIDSILSRTSIKENIQFI